MENHGGDLAALAEGDFGLSGGVGAGRAPFSPRETTYRVENVLILPFRLPYPAVIQGKTVCFRLY